MGSTGRGGLARILVGSVTRRVIQHLPCSLLTVKQENAEMEGLAEAVYKMETYFKEGQALMGAGSFEAALGKFGEVLVLDRFHSAAWEARATAFDKLNRPADAERFRQHVQLLRERK
jgi:Flp pilus assembly protein TadD